MHRLIILSLAVALLVPLQLRATERLPSDVEKLRMLESAFSAYAAKNGAYPTGDNASVVRQMQDPKKGISFEEKVDSLGRLLSAANIPLVFLQSTDGWIVIAIPDKAGTKLDREVALPPWSQSRLTRR